jgi:hypothetical protein
MHSSSPRRPRSAKLGGPARTHKQAAHPPGVVEAVRAYVETTRKTYRQIGRVTGVDSGTISRWAAKQGWTRPPGACARKETPNRPPPPPPPRWRKSSTPNASACWSRSRAPKSDPAALREALDLLVDAPIERRRHYAWLTRPEGE